MHPLTPTRAVLAAMLVQYAAGGAFLPFAKFYLDDLGLEPREVTTIFAGSAAVSATVPLLWGVLADRFVAPHRLLAVMNILSGLTLLVFARLGSFAHVFAGYALYAAFLFPTFAVLNAVAYHHVPNPKRNFGRVRAWGSLGWGLPAALVWGWLSLRENPSVAFLPHVTAALAFLMACVAWRLPSVPSGARRVPGRGAGVYLSALRSLLCRRSFVYLLASVFLSFSSFSVWFYYSPPFLESLGIERRWIGPIQAVGVLAEIPLCFVLGRAIGRWGYRGTLIVGAVALLARQLLYATCELPLLLVASYLLVAISVVCCLVAASLAVEAIAEREVRATAQTLTALAGPGLGQIAGHLSVGWLTGTPGADPRNAFWYGAATALLTLFILVLGVKESDFSRADGR